MPLLLDLYPSVRRRAPVVTVTTIKQDADAQELPQTSTSSGLDTLIQVGPAPIGISKQEIEARLDNSSPEMQVQTFNISLNTSVSEIEQKILILLREILLSTRNVGVTPVSTSANIVSESEEQQDSFVFSEVIDQES